MMRCWKMPYMERGKPNSTKPPAENQTTRWGSVPPRLRPCDTYRMSTAVASTDAQRRILATARMKCSVERSAGEACPPRPRSQ